MSGEMRLIYADELAELREENKRLHAELEAERARNRWIPVGERLPEDERYYLISATHPDLGKVMYMMFYHIYNELWYDKDGYSSRGMSVTHYKPLPELPEATK